LTSVTFSNSGIIKKIGTTSFYGCNNLSAVTFPNSLERIEKAAFKNCSALSSVTFGTGIRYIGRSAFKGTSIREIDLSNCDTSENSMMVIDKYAFRENRNLRAVKLPNWCVLRKESLSSESNQPSSYSDDEFIELTIGKKTIFHYKAFHHQPIKKLTFLYESENDIANETDLSPFGNGYINYIPEGCIVQPASGATLFIDLFIWEKIRTKPVEPMDFYDFYAVLWYAFINGKDRGVFVKDPDTQQYIEMHF
jgi:hypothetical protein